MTSTDLLERPEASVVGAQGTRTQSVTRRQRVNHMTLFRKTQQIHLVGIGGAGMSGIAEVLLTMGYKVTGSDLQASDTTRRLEELGGRIFIGHQESNVGEAQVVVISSAVSPQNPEVVAAKAKQIPVIPRAEMLAELMRMKFSIAVAGTHGKTTTTSLIGHILREGGLDPTVIVGGRVLGVGSNAYLGKSEYLVAEADEFDRSITRFSATISVITNIEAEHMECYRDLDDLYTCFADFANRVPFFGTAVLCIDDPIFGGRTFEALSLVAIFIPFPGLDQERAGEGYRVPDLVDLSPELGLWAPHLVRARAHHRDLSRCGKSSG